MTPSNFLGRAARLSQRSLLLLAGMVLSATGAHAADVAKPAGYPGSGRVSLVVPYSPGGTTDIVARLVSESLTKRWETPVIVENKPGAGGNIAAEYVARAKPDGQTLLFAATAFAAAPALTKSMRYDIHKDFAPISLIATTPLVLMVSKQSGIQTVPELFAKLKSAPEALAYGSSGVGTSINLSTLMLLNRIKAQAIQVQYRGSGPAMTALVSGEISMLFDNYATAMPFVNSGQVKALALSSMSRGALDTDLPPLAEQGLPDFESLTWIGMLAPAGTPHEIVAWLNSEIAAVLQEPALQARLIEMGFNVRSTSPEAFDAFIRQEAGKVRQLVKVNGIEPQ